MDENGKPRENPLPQQPPRISDSESDSEDEDEDEDGEAGRTTKAKVMLEESEYE